MQTIRLLLTFASMVVPNVMIMRAMGWTNTVHFVLVGACGLVATVLILLIPERHRRPELRPRAAVPSLIGWVFLSAVLFGTGWDMRAVLARSLALYQGRNGGNLPKRAPDFHSPPRLPHAGGFADLVIPGVDDLQAPRLLTSEPDERAFRETRWSKLLSVRSQKLSDFHGRDVHLNAAVILPASYYDQPERRYPTIFTIPGFGGTQRLPRLVGKKRALQLILTAEPISAEVAAEYGLINEVVPSVRLMERAREIAMLIIRRPAVAVSACLSSVTQGLDVPLREGLAIEATQFSRAAGMPDVRERIQSFLAPGRPGFESW
jgi:hypothetical protein